jgi:hypothetical protein
MTAPASPLRLHRLAPAPESFGSDALLRKHSGRLSNLAGALFLATLTALSGSALYAFARGPAAPPLLTASSR